MWRSRSSRPDRREANRGKADDDSKYVRWNVYPSSVSKLMDWVEDAYQARCDWADTIDNSFPLMTANSSC